MAFSGDNGVCNKIVEVRLFAIECRRDELIPTIFLPQSIVENLPEAPEDQVVAHLAVLAQFAKFAPNAFEHKSEVIIPFLLKDILMVPSTPDPVSREFSLLILDV